MSRYCSSSTSSQGSSDAAVARPSQKSTSKAVPASTPQHNGKQHNNSNDSKTSPMTAWQRITTFPTGAWLLYVDIRRYYDIQACAASPAPNPWRGRIPRRQRAQQRLLRESAATVVPLVLLWLPPIIGYIPMLLSIAAPRQVLSRHFYNAYEQRHFVRLQDGQRRQYWNTTLTDDTAAVQWALAVGLYSTLPVSYAMAVVSTPWYCRRYTARVFQTVGEDDDCIMEECSEDDEQEYLSAWTFMELMDACYLRGLALSDNDDDRDVLVKRLRDHLAYSRELQSIHSRSAEERGKLLWLRAMKLFKGGEGEEQ